jgi:hypothetical protein
LLYFVLEIEKGPIHPPLLVHRSLQGGVSFGVASQPLRGARCVSRVTVEEVLEGARAASPDRRVRCAGGSDLHRASGEDFGDIRESH